MTIQAPLTLPPLTPTFWELRLPDYPVMGSRFLSSSYPEVLGSLPSGSTWTLKFENVSSSQALALVLPWRATGMGLWPLTALPQELAGGVGSENFKKRLTGTSWSIPGEPEIESAEAGRFNVTIELVYELTFTSLYGPRNPILATASNPVLLGLFGTLGIAGVPAYLDPLLPASRNAGPVAILGMAIGGILPLGQPASRAKAYRQFGAGPVLNMGLPEPPLTLAGESAFLEKSKAGPSSVLEVGQVAGLLPISGTASIGALGSRQLQSGVVELALPADLIFAIEPAGSNVDFSKVALQIPGDGANGSANIIDVSENSLLIARSGNPVITTSSPKYGSGSIQLLNATSDRLAVESLALAPGSQDFWIEFWLRRIDANASPFYVNLLQEELQWFSQVSYVLQSWNSYSESAIGNLEIRLYTGGGVTAPSNFYSARFNGYSGNSQIFNHFCAGRVNGQLAVWFNGVISQDPASINGSAGTVAIGTRNLQPTGNKTFIGPRNTGGGFNNFPSLHLDDLRYVIDTPPWGLSDFTPPASAHPTA